MHAIKGGWVGQTFALASCNDSGGKKSRIRRSKEERKTMVESFIKKYQMLNKGNFPSLNLTHKEVGGSFYTVRELVREIIQENRVLGPAMFPLEEEESKNDIMQHFPVGSIAVQPLICSPMGVSDLLRHTGPNQFPGEKGEHILTPNEHQDLELQSEQELEHHFEDMEEGDESCTTELTFDHHQGVERELLSIEQFSPHEHLNIECVDAGGDSTVIKEVGKSDEQIFVTPLSINHEDINQESHENTISEQVFVSPLSINHDDINQESHENTISEQVFVSPLSINHDDINQESHEDTISEQVLHNGKIFSGDEHLIQASEKNGDFREPFQINIVVEDSLVALKEQSNELGTSLPGNSMRSEVAVETFPLRSVTQTQRINGMEGRPNKDLDRQNAPEEMGNGHEIKNKLENISSLIDVEAGTELASEKVEGSLDEKASPSIGYLSSESLDSLTANETPVADGNNVVITKADVLSIGKVVNVDDLDKKILQSGTMATATKIDPSSMEDISSSNKRPSTLDRTKLETWEGTSEKASATKPEPLVALFKAFIAVIVKFFTE